jgi:hypothetical protein
MAGRPTSPIYDTVVRDLRIDPEAIAARPEWSFKVAEKVRKHRQKEQRREVPPEPRTEELEHPPRPKVGT